VLLWLPLAFLIVALLGSLGWAALGGWRLWLAFRGVSDRLVEATGRVVEAGLKAEERATSLSANGERLAGAVEHLQASLERLAVIRAAVAESASAFGSLRSNVPRK
jgi:hypothetical protein